MWVMSYRCTITSAHLGRRDDTKGSDKKSRCHQENEDDVHGNWNLQLAGVEIDAESDEGSKSTLIMFSLMIPKMMERRATN